MICTCTCICMCAVSSSYQGFINLSLQLLLLHVNIIFPHQYCNWDHIITFQMSTSNAKHIKYTMRFHIDPFISFIPTSIHSFPSSHTYMYMRACHMHQMRMEFQQRLLHYFYALQSSSRVQMRCVSSMSHSVPLHHHPHVLYFHH